MSTRPTLEQVAETIHAVRHARAIKACHGDARWLALLAPEQFAECSPGFREDLLGEAQAVLALFSDAATERPTDEELAKEACVAATSIAYCPYKDAQLRAKFILGLSSIAGECPWSRVIVAYIAGARREGRRA